MNNEWIFHRLFDHQLFEDGYFFNLSSMDLEGPESPPPGSPIYESRTSVVEPQIVSYRFVLASNDSKNEHNCMADREITEILCANFTVCCNG